MRKKNSRPKTRKKTRGANDGAALPPVADEDAHRGAGLAFIAALTPEQRVDLLKRAERQWIDAERRRLSEEGRRLAARRVRAEERFEARKRHLEARCILLRLRFVREHRAAIQHYRKVVGIGAARELQRDNDEVVLSLHQGTAKAFEYADRISREWLYIAIRVLLAPAIVNGAPSRDALESVARALAILSTGGDKLISTTTERLESAIASAREAVIIQQMRNLETSVPSGAVVLATGAVAEIAGVTASAVNKWKPRPERYAYLTWLLGLVVPKVPRK